MKPLKNFVLVTQAEIQQTTASGIVLSGTSADSGSKPGKVEAVGPEVTTIQVGDQVAVKWGEALAVQYEGRDAALISDEAIYAIY